VDPRVRNPPPFDPGLFLPPFNSLETVASRGR
jgi:hypothetical protein